MTTWCSDGKHECEGTAGSHTHTHERWKGANKQTNMADAKERDGEKNGLQKPRICECDASHETMMKSTVGWLISNRHWVSHTHTHKIHSDITTKSYGSTYSAGVWIPHNGDETLHWTTFAGSRAVTHQAGPIRPSNLTGLIFHLCSIFHMFAPSESEPMKTYIWPPSATPTCSHQTLTAQISCLTWVWHALTNVFASLFFSTGVI